MCDVSAVLGVSVPGPAREESTYMTVVHVPAGRRKKRPSWARDKVSLLLMPISMVTMVIFQQSVLRPSVRGSTHTTPPLSSQP